MVLGISWMFLVVLAGYCGLIVLVVFSSHGWLLVFVCVCWWLLVILGGSW